MARGDRGDDPSRACAPVRVCRWPLAGGTAAFTFALAATPALATADVATSGRALAVGVRGPAAPDAAPSAGDQPAAPVPGANPSAEAYTAAQAVADVEVCLTDITLEYTRARARLVAHPDLAAPALIARLDGVPPPGPAGRKRLLDLLALLDRGDDLPRLADELRRAVQQAPSDAAALEAAERWRPLLLERGPAAVPALLELVGDTQVPTVVRALLLADTVELANLAELPALTGLVGRGGRALQRPLRQALERRARTDSAAATAIQQAALAAVDPALEAAEGDPAAAERAAQLLGLAAALRHASGAEQDAAWTDQLVRLTAAATAPFAVRITAARALARIHGERPAAAERWAPEQRATLTAAAQRGAAAGVAGDQREELVAATLLGLVPAAQLAEIDAALGLRDAALPRLAIATWERIPLEADATVRWLESGLAHPWPEVRSVVVARVANPCPRGAVVTLARLAGAPAEGGDPDGRVARAATEALARCDSAQALQALTRLLDDRYADVDRIAAAARALTRVGGPEGADAVARRLQRADERKLATRLATALGRAPAATPRVTEALCAAMVAGRAKAPELARAARSSLERVAPTAECLAADPGPASPAR